METPTTALLAASLIVLFAFFTRAFTGFGGALLCVPLLALLYDLRVVVPVECALEVAISLILVPRVFRDVDGRNLALLLAGALCGSVVGVHLLQSLGNASLKRALGVVIILAALHLVRKRASTGNPVSRKWGLVAGFFGGLLGGVFGTPGPAYIAYLAHQTADNRVFRATLIVLFAVEYTWRLALFAFEGLYAGPQLELSMWLVPAALAGAIAGHVVHFRVDERVFRIAVCSLLVVSGALCFV